jgi:trans-aconitate 2-methyltransferase
MTDARKDFTPIQEDYAFFESHSTEAESDLGAYAERLAAFEVPDGPLRMLDFGCGPGTFTARFLERVGWRGERLELALVEPATAYREQAVARLSALTERPIRDWEELPAGVAREFDLILSNHVLYYVSDLEGVIRGIVGALAPGGVFLTAIAGRDNGLVEFWIRGFARIGRELPYHTAEDVENVLEGLGRKFERREVRYRLSFADSEENRMKILRFLFGEHLGELPREDVLEYFEPYVSGGRVEMGTGNVQYFLEGGE